MDQKESHSEQTRNARSPRFNVEKGIQNFKVIVMLVWLFYLSYSQTLEGPGDILLLEL